VIGGVDGAAGGEAFRDDRFPCLYYSAFASGMLLGRAE
jgi:hypothetical protein